MTPPVEEYGLLEMGLLSWNSHKVYTDRTYIFSKAFNKQTFKTPLENDVEIFNTFHKKEFSEMPIVKLLSEFFDIVANVRFV